VRIVAGFVAKLPTAFRESMLTQPWAVVKHDVQSAAGVSSKQRFEPNVFRVGGWENISGDGQAGAVSKHC